MPNVLFLRDLRGLTEEEREKALEQFCNAPPNGAAAAIDMQIKEYERRYEMTSATMRQKLEAHELRETNEIADWYVLLKVRAGEL